MAYQPPQNIQIIIRDTADTVMNGVKSLIYGGAGVGKTVLMSTLPGPIILSAEAGTLSLAGVHLPYIEVGDMATLEAAYQWAAYSDQARQFYSIGIDSASEIAEKCLAAEKITNKDPRKAYGEMADRMMIIFRAFRDLPGRHVAFSAKMGRMTDQLTGGTMWGPMMPGQQLDQQLPYMFDEVFQLGVYRDPTGNPYRALRTQPDNQYQAKDRSGLLDAWEQPNLTAIIEKIMRGRQ
jgi:hypothetical protein